MAGELDKIVSKTLEKISESHEVTSADLFVLKYCRQEQKRAGYVSPVKRFAQDAGDIFSLARTLLGGLGNE